MKKLAIVVLAFNISGCTSYQNRNDLADCLSLGYYKNKITNKKIIDAINSKGKIKEFLIKGKGTHNKLNDEVTECPVIAYYDDGKLSNGILSSTGRWSKNHEITYKYLTVNEYQKEDRLKTAEISNKNNESIIKNKNNMKKSLKDFDSAGKDTYPFMARIYCFNTKNFEIYTPETCGISIYGAGPSNLYSKNKSSLDVMLLTSYSLKVFMSEPNPFLAIKVDIISRRTDKVIDTRIGNFIHSIAFKK